MFNIICIRERDRETERWVFVEPLLGFSLPLWRKRQNWSLRTKEGFGMAKFLTMFICVHVCMCICICMAVFVYVCLYACMNTCTHAFATFQKAKKLLLLLLLLKL